MKAVETLSNIERRLDGIVAAGSNNSREEIDMNSMFSPVGYALEDQAEHYHEYLILGHKMNCK